MIRRIFPLAILAMLFLFTAACDKEDLINPDDQRKTTGFVAIVSTSSGSAIAKYVEELPADGGTINLSENGTDFQRFFPTSLVNSALFMTRPDGSAGFSKYEVNGNGELVETGVIPTAAASSFRIAARDADVGVFHDRANPDQITVFNPTTMQVTNTIDMTAAPVPGDIPQRYQKFYFRGNDVFGFIRGEDGSGFTSFVVHQANLSSNTYVGSTQREGNGFSEITAFSSFGQNVIDDAGNLYIADAGDLNGSGLPASLNKIPAGSNSFDPSYQFFPAQVLNPANFALPMFDNFFSIAGNRAIAKVNAETPQAVIDIVTAAGGVQNLSPDQINQVLGILFTAESARWCVLDLVAKSVTPISGIPNVGAFAAGGSFRHNGEFYLAVPTAGEQAYYRYNPSSGTATKAFTVTGGDLAGVYNLAENN